MFRSRWAFVGITAVLACCGCGETPLRTTMRMKALRIPTITRTRVTPRNRPTHRPPPLRVETMCRSVPRVRYRTFVIVAVEVLPAAPIPPVPTNALPALAAPLPHASFEACFSPPAGTRLASLFVAVSLTPVKTASASIPLRVARAVSLAIPPLSMSSQTRIGVAPSRFVTLRRKYRQ